MNRKNKKCKHGKDVLNDMQRSWENKNDEIKTDVLGSYTGTVAGDEYEIPQQDADDL